MLKLPSGLTPLSSSQHSVPPNLKPGAASITNGSGISAEVQRTPLNFHNPMSRMTSTPPDKLLKKKVDPSAQMKFLQLLIQMQMTQIVLGASLKTDRSQVQLKHAVLQSHPGS